MNDYAIESASRFGDIPFVEFTRDLVTGIFDSLVDAHILQMEEYANFANSMSLTLSAYINNTIDGVSFEQITEFVENYTLPEPPDELTLEGILDNLDTGSTDPLPITSTPTESENWWQGLVNTLAPAVVSLVDKIEDPSEALELQALLDYNDAVIEGAELEADLVPNYSDLYKAIASLITSNKYSLLRSMVDQGMMRLVVTEGEIETKITFSTWNNSTSGSTQSYSKKNDNRIKTKLKASGGIGFIFRAKAKRKRKNRTVTVNTAKSYQRDSSGTRVDIFGRCLIKFKTDYRQLNG